MDQDEESEMEISFNGIIFVYILIVLYTQFLDSCYLKAKYIDQN